MDDIMTFDQLYRDYTLKALNRAGTIADAAKLLGVSRRTVLRWKRSYDIIRDRKAPKYKIKPPVSRKTNSK